MPSPDAPGRDRQIPEMTTPGGHLAKSGQIKQQTPSMIRHRA